MFGKDDKMCTFGQSYTEGSSWKAYQAIDKFYCGSNTMEGIYDEVDASFAIDFKFGCQQSETGLFVGQLADGIMGMAANDATLVNHMKTEGRLEHDMFAICFKRRYQQSKRGVVAGVMTLGGMDTRLHTGPMVYADNKVADGWFTVYVKGIYLLPNDEDSKNNEKPVKPLKVNFNKNTINSGKGVIVDSGTTDTYFHRDLHVTFNHVWKDLVGSNHGNDAMRLTAEQLAALPTLLVQLEAYGDGDLMDGNVDENGYSGLVGSDISPGSPNDVLLAIPPEHYMEFSPTDETYTSRLYFSESAGGVLGANAMMGHDVLFDIENGRLGFAESSCEYQDLQDDFEGSEDEGEGMGDDCRLGEPSLAKGCISTVDLSECDEEGRDEVRGHTRLVVILHILFNRLSDGLGVR